MLAEVQTLTRLQELDTALDSARSELDRVEHQLGSNPEVVVAREALAAATSGLRESQHRVRELEYQIQDLSTKLATDEARLYGGRLGTRDLQALQREIDHIKTQRADAEDALLLLLDEVEERERAVTQSEKHLAETQSAWERSQADLVARRDELRGQISEREAQRSRLVSQVSPPTLAIYDELRRTRKGLAVVAVERNTCRGCRIDVPSSVVTRVRLGRDVMRCPSCGRILVVGR